MQPRPVGHNIKPEESWNWFREGVKKFTEGEARGMQSQRYPAPGNEDAINFCQRLLNVHVREGDAGNRAIETFIGKRQAFPRPLQIGSLREPYPGNLEAALVDVETGYFIRRGHTPQSEIPSRSAAQIQDSQAFGSQRSD